MSTWAYLPILGDFSLISIFNAAGTTAAAGANPGALPPRAGRLKWGMALHCTDSTGANESALEIVVQTPLSVNLPTYDSGFINQYSLAPLVSLTSKGSTGAMYTQRVTSALITVATKAVMESVVGIPGNLLTPFTNPNYLLAAVGVVVANPVAAALDFFLTIDFSHSLIN